jgi:hypothetical protein
MRSRCLSSFSQPAAEARSGQRDHTAGVTMVTPAERDAPNSLHRVRMLLLQTACTSGSQMMRDGYYCCTKHVNILALCHQCASLCSADQAESCSDRSKASSSMRPLFRTASTAARCFESLASPSAVAGSDSGSSMPGGAVDRPLRSACWLVGTDSVARASAVSNRQSCGATVSERSSSTSRSRCCGSDDADPNAPNGAACMRLSANAVWAASCCPPAASRVA